MAMDIFSLFALFSSFDRVNGWFCTKALSSISTHIHTHTFQAKRSTKGAKLYGNGAAMINGWPPEKFNQMRKRSKKKRKKKREKKTRISMIIICHPDYTNTHVLIMTSSDE